MTGDGGARTLSKSLEVAFPRPVFEDELQTILVDLSKRMSPGRMQVTYEGGYVLRGDDDTAVPLDDEIPVHITTKKYRGLIEAGASVVEFIVQNRYIGAGQTYTAMRLSTPGSGAEDLELMRRTSEQINEYFGHAGKRK